MELLVEIFTQPTNWDREHLLQSRRDRSVPLALLSLGHVVKPIEELLSDSEIMRLNPEDYAREAAARLRQSYPHFTTQVARETGLIDLYIWQGQISWWWFLPFSEKSSFRTPLIEWLYWFCILEVVLERNEITLVHLAVDNPDYGYALAELCHKCNVPLGEVNVPTGKRVSDFKLAMTFIRRFLAFPLLRTLQWLTLKWFRLDSVVDYERIGSKSVIFCTFYPTFFEQSGDPGLLNEKLFGTWPGYLAQKGHSIVYAATIALSFKEIVSSAQRLRQHVARNNIVILESLWSLSDLLKINLDSTFLWRYWRWRKRHAGRSLVFREVDVHRLVVHELDQDIFFKQEGPDSAGVCYAVRRLVEKLGGVRCVCYTFEYQPRERAISVGVRMTARSIPVIGFQISMFTFNHLPWFFPKEEAQQPHAGGYDARLAPLPDYVVAYGRSDYEVFGERFLPGTVILAGPIRYVQLAQDVQTEVNTDAFRQAHNIPADAALLLLATSITRAETVQMMHLALRAVAALPGAYLLVKFHPHLPLRQELAEVAEEVGFTNYQIFNSNLNTLLKVSKAAILATTTVGVEAIALNCMPIVFYKPGNFEPHPLRDFPEAAFFCQNVAELKVALAECLREGELYRQRKAHWPRVVESLLYRLDGNENGRLYEALRSRGIF